MSLLPYQHFRHCPHCGSRAPSPPQTPRFVCSSCQFTFFFNPAVAGGAFLRRTDGALLWLRRAQDPARGKLGVPGGFIDYQESAEDGLRREIREEIGIEMGVLSFLCTQVNHYTYRDVTYPVVDLFFSGHLPEQARPQCLDDVDELVWLQPRNVDPAELAFPSTRAAFALLLEPSPAFLASQ